MAPARWQLRLAAVIHVRHSYLRCAFPLLSEKNLSDPDVVGLCVPDGVGTFVADGRRHAADKGGGLRRLAPAAERGPPASS